MDLTVRAQFEQGTQFVEHDHLHSEIKPIVSANLSHARMRGSFAQHMQ